MDKKQTKSTLPWLGVQTGGIFHTAQTWGLERLWLLGKARSVKWLRVAHVCPRHTSNQFNTGEANPLRLISNIDLLRLSFPVNFFFFFFVSSNYPRNILAGLALSSFLSRLRTESPFSVRRGFFPVRHTPVRSIAVIYSSNKGAPGVYSPDQIVAR